MAARCSNYNRLLDNSQRYQPYNRGRGRGRGPNNMVTEIWAMKMKAVMNDDIVLIELEEATTDFFMASSGKKWWVFLVSSFWVLCSWLSSTCQCMNAVKIVEDLVENVDNGQLPVPPSHPLAIKLPSRQQLNMVRSELSSLGKPLLFVEDKIEGQRSLMLVDFAISANLPKRSWSWDWHKSIKILFKWQKVWYQRYLDKWRKLVFHTLYFGRKKVHSKLLSCMILIWGWPYLEVDERICIMVGFWL